MYPKVRRSHSDVLSRNEMALRTTIQGSGGRGRKNTEC